MTVGGYFPTLPGITSYSNGIHLRVARMRWWSPSLAEVHMPLSCRSLCIAGLAATLTPCALAQVPAAVDSSPSEITLESWLRSGEPRLVAWGAHDALATHNRNLIPDLLSLASHWRPLSQPNSGSPPHSELSAQQSEERDAMAAVLDALIQMNVPVPADTLRALAPDLGNDVAILLSRMPDEDSGPLSLDFYRSLPEQAYSLRYVSAALLALHPRPEFVADLFANIRVRATIIVVDPGPQGGFGSAGCCGLSSEPPREGWPETGQYSLSTQKSDAASLVVAGIDPIYATRTLSTAYVGDRCGTDIYLGPNQRLRLIAGMLGVAPETIPWQTAPQTTIEYQSLDHFEAALIAFVTEQQRQYRATAGALADRNLLSLADAQQSFPELELTLMDMREENTEPIPRLSNLPARVEWSSSPF